ncbi:PHP domain-containing protein [Metabacillus sp. Hm71]|uniref:PHP domain-containing protein n=1 Tax=Metabacillus sp. Hm71 TaxID=3450743 RepID=UPI003F427285
MIDLHCHTNISDNSYSFEEVIRLAKLNGVKHLAITDHDTTKGLFQAMEIGESLGVEIIPGIEISAYDYERNRRAHILGLYITPGHASIDELCSPLVAKRHEASWQMVSRIQEAGYDITWEEVLEFCKEGTGVYKQHIMHALLKKGYTDRIYGDLYNKLFKRGDSPNDRGLAFISIEYIDVMDAIRVIREAGGLPILAHPGQFDNFSAVEDWVQAGLEGIEVLHPLHDKEAEKKARALAEKWDLIQTGGSDFHGFYGESSAVSIGAKSIGLEHFTKLLERRNILQKN